MYSLKIIPLCVLFSLFFNINYSQVQDSILSVYKKDNQKQEIGSLKDNYLFVYSGQYDMIGDAQNLFTISRLFGRGLDELTCKPDKITGLNNCFKKENFFGRLFIDFGLNFMFTNWLSTVQHEYMGHGFRAREFNARINKTVIKPFWGGSYLDFHREDLPYYGLLLEEPGGSESNTVFSRESFRQSLLNDYFYHYYFYSFVLKIDLPMYIIGGTPKVGSYEWINPTHGRDIIRYIKAFNSKSKDGEQQIYNSAQKGAYWSLADPCLLISLFNYTRDFIIYGKSQVRNPMIKIRNISFLPFTDFHLSPFGFEYYIGSYLKYNMTLYETYYRWSSGNIDGSSYGLGLNILNLTQYHNFRFDAGFDLWSQGFNLIYYETDDNKYNDKVISGKIYLKTSYHINNTFFIIGQISYKGDGFLLGNPIKKGFNAKIGIGFTL